MTKLDDYVLEGALNRFDEATHLHICSAEPTSFANVASVSLGVKAGPTFAAFADGTPSGRKVVCNAIDDGEVTADGEATHWALVDQTNSRLLGAKTLAETRASTLRFEAAGGAQSRSHIGRAIGSRRLAGLPMNGCGLLMSITAHKTGPGLSLTDRTRMAAHLRVAHTRPETR